MQHLVHGDRELVVVAKDGLGERVSNENHLDAGLIDQARSRVVVGGEASDRFVPDFLFAKRSGGDLLAGLVVSRHTGTRANSTDAHCSSIAPPAPRIEPLPHLAGFYGSFTLT